MKIKRLEISGFKSFVDKSVLDFPEGVTAVVGPNGCGKSNIVDAIRWVMGEQSVKNLRGRYMEDMIFGGSEARKPLGMAEVSLIFSTEDGKIPAKYLNYSEIQVTRRLYRDGDSEYLLNKTPCRLMDIAELFMDTGVGARAYSIIEQGRIGMILMAKPEERRFLIEEAAGVTKYKARKQIAVKKIEVTRQNLLRISDIVAEIKRQLNSLQRQAKRAEKFRTFREELKEIDIYFAIKEYKKLLAEQNALDLEMKGFDEREVSLVSAGKKQELDIESKKVVLIEVEKRLNSNQEQLFALKGNLKGEENRIEFQKKEVENREREAIRLKEELSSVEQRLLEAADEEASLKLKSGELLSESTGSEQLLDEREKELEELLSSERTASARIDELRKELFKVISEIGQSDNRQKNAVQRLEVIRERVERSQKEEVTLKDRFVEVQKRVSGFEAEFEKGKAAKEKLQSLISSLTQRYDELKAASAVTEKEFQSTKDEFGRVSSRLHSVQELEASFEGYGEGVKSLFTSESFKGRFSGMVADFIETDEKYEAAVEAILGGLLQAVPSDSGDDVTSAIDYLRSSGNGRCSFILPNGKKRASESAPKGMESLASKVRLKEKYKPFLESFLETVFITKDLKEAIKAANDFPELTFVTLEGDMVYRSSVVEGGGKEGANQGLIHKKREIKELASKVTKYEKLINELSHKLEQQKAGTDSVDKEISSSRQELHNSEMAILALEKDMQSGKEELRLVEERINIKAFEDGQLQEERELLEKDQSEADSVREEALKKKEAFEAELSDAQGVVSTRQQLIEKAREEVTAMKIRSAALREKQEAMVNSLKRVAALQIELKNRKLKLNDDIEKGDKERIGLGESINSSETGISDLLQKYSDMEKEALSLKEEYELSAHSLRDMEASDKEARSIIDSLRKEKGDAHLKLTELSMRLNHLEETFRDKYRLNISEAVSEKDSEATDEAALNKRHAELSKDIEAIGEVNLMAIEEYQELEQRYTFLDGQKKDLEESLHSL
ncbi:MAG: chromosome segregation protein SMC, partial [Desulfuromonadales bacterium]|nr:chromosome segregation protein SMC [Desulfuromonadales bacterium]